MNRDEFLKRIKESRREKIVDGVRLLEPTIEGRLAFETSWRSYDGDEVGRIVSTIVACAVDDDGKPFFGDAESIATLRNEAGGAFAKRLFDACYELLAIATADEVESAVGECDGDPSSSTSTGSLTSAESPTPS